MADKTIILENPNTGQTREAPVGFSWTVLFFNFFVPFFRSDWKWAIIMFLAGILTYGLSALFFMFIYNKLYIKDLLSVGFRENSLKSEKLDMSQYSKITPETQDLAEQLTHTPTEIKEAFLETINLKEVKSKVSSKMNWSDYVFWGGLAMCALFVLVAAGQLIEKNKNVRTNIVTKYIRHDGTPLTPAEVTEHLRIERISRQAGRGTRATDRRNSVGGGLTSTDELVISEYENRRKAGDIRGACGAMMLYSGPNAQNAKARIASTCAGYGVSTFSGINGY